jgi:hypothetical protein
MTGDNVLPRQNAGQKMLGGNKMTSASAKCRREMKGDLGEHSPAIL